MTAPSRSDPSSTATNDSRFTLCLVLSAALAVAIISPAATLHARMAAGVNRHAGTEVIRVNEFLSYSLANKVVHLRLVAGYDSTNDTLNFNGGALGSHRVIVPVGWRVELELVNHNTLPHSAMVFATGDSLPVTPEHAALPGARTLNHGAGIERHKATHIAFSARTPGVYRLICAVPYHAQDGMWIHFHVSRTAKRPGYELIGAHRAHHSD